MSPRWSGIDSAVGAALLDELSESPLPGARYAREVVRRRLPDVLTEARAATVAPVLEALRHYGKHVEWPRCASLRNAANPCDCGLSTTLSAPPLRPSGEPEPGGLDVERLAELLHQTAPFNHNLGEGPLRAICDSTAAHSPRAQRIIALARLAATPERPADEAGT